MVCRHRRAVREQNVIDKSLVPGRVDAAVILLSGADGMSFVPTQQHLRYLRAYLDPTTAANIKAVAEAANVNRRNVYRWLDDPLFCAWFTAQCEGVFKHRVHAMWAKC